MFLHFVCGILNGAHDVVVAGAAAEVPFQGMADFRFARIGVVLEQIGGQHNHAGGAEPALEAVFLVKALLEGVHAPIRGQSLYRGDGASVCLGSQHGTGLDGVAVYQNGAGTATAGIATDVCARQAQGGPQVLHQQVAWRHLAGVLLAIDGYLNVY